MLYKLAHAFYKRDTYFGYSEKNDISDYFWLVECKKQDYSKPVLYEVDKFDSDLLKRDILPTMGAKLVSKRFRDAYQHLEDKEIQFIPAIIKDEKSGIENYDFFVLNPLKLLSLLDFERSLYLPYGIDDEDEEDEIDEDYLEIMQAFYCEENMNPFSIARMKENILYIIVSENFVEVAKKAGLQGIDFNPEGYTGAYTELGLEETRKRMKDYYGK